MNQEERSRTTENAALTEAELESLDRALRPALEDILRRRISPSTVRSLETEGTRWIAEWYHDDLLKRAKADAWEAALDHVWALSDPVSTINTDNGERPVVTRFDIAQAKDENPYSRDGGQSDG